MTTDKRKEFEALKKYYKPLLPNKCQNCKSSGELVMHHIVPLIVGGTNHLSNICVLCQDCHSKVHRNATGNKISIKELSAAGVEHKKQLEENENMVEASELYQGGLLTVKDITKITGVSRSALYAYIKENNIRRN